MDGAVAARLAIEKLDHQPCVMLDEIQPEGPEADALAEVAALLPQRPQPRPEAGLEIIAEAKRAAALYQGREAARKNAALSSSRDRLAARTSAS